MMPDTPPACGTGSLTIPINGVCGLPSGGGQTSPWSWSFMVITSGAAKVRMWWFIPDATMSISAGFFVDCDCTTAGPV